MDLGREEQHWTLISKITTEKRGTHLVKMLEQSQVRKHATHSKAYPIQVLTIYRFSIYLSLRGGGTKQKKTPRVLICSHSPTTCRGGSEIGRKK